MNTYGFHEVWFISVGFSFLLYLLYSWVFREDSYDYFISYVTFPKPGHGSCDVTLNRPIKSKGDLDLVIKAVLEQMDDDEDTPTSLQVLYWKEYK